ncbi:glycerophosphodiester phosphodiesterase [Boudabousia tangfeifanii]|uniref:Glycerophosphodiester phosphodiesterase n=1 Tax=Boudabousia tangfeifanii TaxID=1912795 RepID=A0A1D9ML21_9ACTO|nr:ABC-F family ATP-binding cassette domain-containing protein [Boudabousia tangfeifanii]AOZ72975.1 glycerophosphodiester phosphodiesterase [Boudabousia tangfeifanii]
MHLIGLQQVRALAGSRILLDDITLGLEAGARVGVLGPNGAGKSTLLRILAGTGEIASGLRTVTGGVEIAMLSQQDDFTPEMTVAEAIHAGKEAHEWATDPKIRQIHTGLLADVPLDALVANLSGGQRRRVALAAALTAPAQVLCLDEPTNHLDVEGVDWLVRHLQERFSGSGKNKGALVVVTHDRWFLDALCTRVWEVVPGIELGNGRPQLPGRIEFYDGSYAAYVLARAERARQNDLAAQKRENLLRKELAWLRRGAPARTSKPRFRIAAAETLIADVPPPRDNVELLKMATARLGKDVVDLEDVSLSFPQPEGEPKVILDEVTWRLAPAERVGIVGVNGAGKTTLLRLLEGVLPPSAGRVKTGKTVKIATLSQATHELDAVADLRVVEAVNEVAATITVGGKELTASQLTERLGFTKSRAWTQVKELSGGERRRLQLMRLLMSEPNVLLLDEPTNDLDTDTLAAMEDLLDSFPGTLVVVSHDRYLLERVTDHQVALLGDGKLRDLPGGVEQYLEMRRAQAQGANVALTGFDKTEQSNDETAGDQVASDEHSAASSTLSAAERRLKQKEADKLERQLQKANQAVEKLHAKLEEVSAQAMTSEKAQEQLAQLGRDLQAANEQVEELEMAWLEAAAEL